MAGGNESMAAYQWIYSKLSADSALAALVGTRIYLRQADQGAGYPYVVILKLSGIDSNTISGDRVMANLLFLVKGIAEGNNAGNALEAVNARIDTLLQKSRNQAVSKGQILACTRESDFELLENDPKSAKQWLHLGGNYRILAQ
jgi:hypothetical protein